MSAYDEGHEKGYEDAIAGKDNMYNFLTGSGSGIMDIVIPVQEGEEEWSEGYRNGWEAGNAET